MTSSIQTGDQALMHDAIQSGFIPSNLRPVDQDNITCTLCNSTMCGVIPLVAHLKGGAHTRKANNRRAYSSAMISPSNLGQFASDIHSSHCDNDGEQAIIKNEIKNGNIIAKSESVYSCLPCNILVIYGAKPLYAHLVGKGHAKKVQNPSLTDNKLLVNPNSFLAGQTGHQQSNLTMSNLAKLPQFESVSSALSSPTTYNSSTVYFPQKNYHSVDDEGGLIYIIRENEAIRNHRYMNLDKL